MLNGSYNLSEVDEYLKKEDVKGAYILSRGENVAHYVGRSSNLKARLKSHQQEAKGYTQFWYEPTDSVLEAYYSECKLYHKYNPADNENHPATPPDSTWKCPVTGCPSST